MKIESNQKGLMTPVLDYLDGKVYLNSPEEISILKEKFRIRDIADGVMHIIEETPFILKLGAYDATEGLCRDKILDGEWFSTGNIDWCVYLPIASGKIDDNASAFCVSRNHQIVFFAPKKLIPFLKNLSIHHNAELCETFYSDEVAGNVRTFFKGKEEQTIEYHSLNRFCGEVKIIPNVLEYSVVNYVDDNDSEKKKTTVEPISILHTLGQLQKWNLDFSGQEIWKSEALSPVHERLGLKKVGKYYIFTKYQLIIKYWTVDPLSLERIDPSIIAQNNLVEITPKILAGFENGRTWIAGVYDQKCLSQTQADTVFVETNFSGRPFLPKEDIIQTLRKKAEDILKSRGHSEENIAPAQNDELFQEIMRSRPGLYIARKDVENMPPHYKKSLPVDTFLGATSDGVTLQNIRSMKNWPSLSQNTAFRHLIFSLASQTK